MLVEYWAGRFPRLSSVAVSAEKIDRLLPASSKGIQGKGLKSFLEQNGFDVFVFDGEVSDLRHHFEKGRPLLVCFAASGSREPLHYALVAGIDQAAIYLNDPARGKLFRETLTTFLEEWRSTDNWALLAVPRQSQ